MVHDHEVELECGSQAVARNKVSSVRSVEWLKKKNECPPARFSGRELDRVFKIWRNVKIMLLQHCSGKRMAIESATHLVSRAGWKRLVPTTTPAGIRRI